MVISGGDLAARNRQLGPAAELRYPADRAELFPSLGRAVAEESPGPDVGVVLEVVARKQAVDAVGQSQRVTRVNTVEPLQRPEQRRRPEVDLLQPGSGLKRAVEYLSQSRYGFATSVKSNSSKSQSRVLRGSVAIHRSFGIKVKRKRNGQRRDVTQSGLSEDGSVATGTKPRRSLTMEGDIGTEQDLDYCQR